MKILSVIPSVLLASGMLCILPGCGDSAPEPEKAPAQTQTPSPVRRTPVQKVRAVHEMKQLGALLLMYANDNEDFLPPDLDALGEYGAGSPGTIANAAYVGSGLRVTSPGIASLPVLFDRPRTFSDGKIGVLCADGHVEMTPVAGEAPATCRETADLLLRDKDDSEAARIIRENAGKLDRAAE